MSPNSWFNDETPENSELLPIVIKGKWESTSIRVLSSEIVAEVIGKDGSKIKELRAKTNTIIRTPKPGNSPIFLISGTSQEDLAKAVHEIQSMATHFMLIRGLTNSSNTPCDVTVKVTIPVRFVGLVIGYNGQMIQSIQCQSETYIISPFKNGPPIFEIIGLPSNVAKAKYFIESYIESRTAINRKPISDIDNYFKQLALESAFDESGKSDNYFTSGINNCRFLKTNESAVLNNMRKPNFVESIPAAGNSKAVGAEINLIRRSRCNICKLKAIEVAFPHCYHVLACMDCANRVITSNNPICDVCGQILEEIRVFKK